MKLTIYQVDAFAEKLFQGNPAAVIPLQQWLDDELLQNIAVENNLSETAFFVAKDDGFQLRWFTPAEEVDLCGHATLATAHVLFQHLAYEKSDIQFQTRSGELMVSRSDAGSGYTMDFPILPAQAVTAPAALLAGLGTSAKHILKADDYIVVFETEADVQALTPDLSQWMKLDARGVIVTALGTDVDFVARCFFPQLNIDEDPVTGSAYCELAPYWYSILGRKQMTARQLSKRSGILHCDLKADRILITGKAIDYMTGEIYITAPT